MGLPTDLVTNLELRLAYSPAEGRLWRLDGACKPGRELAVWRWGESEERGRVKINTIWLGTKHKVLTHAIYYMMTGKWPGPGRYIDHLNRDPRDNRAANLREVTPTQNAMNTDRGGPYWRARDELLEQGVHKRSNGAYQVMVCGVYGGSFRSRVEANEVCRKLRRELKGEYDIPAITWRRIIRLGAY